MRGSACLAEEGLESGGTGALMLRLQTRLLRAGEDGSHSPSPQALVELHYCYLLMGPCLLAITGGHWART